MTEAFATVNGISAQRVRLHVGNAGPWVAVITLASDEAIAGKVIVKLGGLSLTGTISEDYSGEFAGERTLRVVAGAGAWGAVVPRRGYHNDAGVKSKLIVEDVAREVGETLGGFVPAMASVGTDYARETGAAVRTLEDVTGWPQVAWWVDYAGVTHVGVRAAATADKGGYDVVAYDPGQHVAELAITDPLAVSVGDLIGPGLDAPRTVRELELSADVNGLRLMVWLGGGEADPDRLVGLVRKIVQRATDGALYGAYRYRVARMVGGRCELQPVHTALGLPDLTGIEVWPGLASAHADLTPGVHVLVSFIEGDRAQPFVSHVAPRGAQGWVPVSLTLGGEVGAPVARQGDPVEVFMPAPMVFNGTISGAPVVGTLVYPAMKTIGVISGGSTKVKVAP